MRVIVKIRRIEKKLPFLDNKDFNRIVGTIQSSFFTIKTIPLKKVKRQLFGGPLPRVYDIK